jgi:hypothetical protein
MVILKTFADFVKVLPTPVPMTINARSIVKVLNSPASKPPIARSFVKIMAPPAHLRHLATQELLVLACLVLVIACLEVVNARTVIAVLASVAKAPQTIVANAPTAQQ